MFLQNTDESPESNGGEDKHDGATAVPIQQEVKATNDQVKPEGETTVDSDAPEVPKTPEATAPNHATPVVADVDEVDKA